MDNFDKLIEKYKREMLGLSKRSVYDNVSSSSGEEKEQKPAEALTDNKKEEITGPEIIKNENGKTAHYGFLKVAVFAGNEAFPVQTAKIEVFDKNGNMLYSLLTNSGGIAEGMVLETPPKSDNDEPGGEDGFSSYIVRVSHPDYGTQEFDDVQVFEGIESIQQVFFQPDVEFYTDEEG